MRFCSQCAAPVTRRIPAEDNRERFVCDECGTIHYQNPKNVTGCILEWEGRVLLCRRAIEPRLGFWTAPAGFMENGETLAQGAAREALEEAEARAEALNLLGVFNLPHISQVYVMFRGLLGDGIARAGHESLEVRLFEEREIPWDELAFPVIHEALERFFEDRRLGRPRMHMSDILRLPDRRIEIRRYDTLG